MPHSMGRTGGMFSGRLCGGAATGRGGSDVQKVGICRGVLGQESSRRSALIGNNVELAVSRMESSLRTKGLERFGGDCEIHEI